MNWRKLSPLLTKNRENVPDRTLDIRKPHCLVGFFVFWWGWRVARVTVDNCRYLSITVNICKNAPFSAFFCLFSWWGCYNLEHTPRKNVPRTYPFYHKRKGRACRQTPFPVRDGRGGGLHPPLYQYYHVSTKKRGHFAPFSVFRVFPPVSVVPPVAVRSCCEPQPSP